MRKRKTPFDDGFQAYLTVGAEYEGEEGIPKMLGLGNIRVPKGTVSFPRCKNEKNKRLYVHFYVHDYLFFFFFSATKEYV